MHDTEDPTRSSAADAAGMAADYSARHTYARGYDDGRKAEKARADAAEQRVCELRECLRDAGNELVDTNDKTAGILGDADIIERVQAALASTADIAGRWVPKADLDLLHAKMGMVVAERDAAIARAEDLKRQADTAVRVGIETTKRADAAIAARDEAINTKENVILQRDAAIARAEKAEHDNAVLQQVIQSDATQIRDAERARDELGIQYAAAQAEIARQVRALAGMRLLRRDGVMPDRVARAMDAILSDLDTVPGDALAPVVTDALAPSAIVGVHPCGKERPVGAVGVAQAASGERFFIDGNGDRIDTSNVKGGE